MVVTFVKLKEDKILYTEDVNVNSINKVKFLEYDYLSFRSHAISYRISYKDNIYTILKIQKDKPPVSSVLASLMEVKVFIKSLDDTKPR